MTSRESSILGNRLVPIPKRITFTDGDYFRLCDACRIALRVPSRDMVCGIAELISQFWGIRPTLLVSEARSSTHAEGYAVTVTASEVTITASGQAGILNALKTLRQLAEAERGQLTFSAYELPPCSIEDAPAMEFRGLHLCWFPENREWQIERAIRMAAYYKFNHVVLETWGVFPFESHPFLCWPEPERRLDRRGLARIIAEAQRLGVTVIPQFNMLGHASGSREVGGKHTILNVHPEYQPLFEPDGWSWCLTNPATRKVLTDVTLELLAFFGKPPYFHLGCDEARLLGTCRSCRARPPKELVKDHLIHFHGLLREHGARAIMWHDMLLNREDPRWAHYTVCGHEAHGLGDLYRELPRDIVIADWQYEYPEVDGKAPVWPTSRFFKDEGFAVLVCPGQNLKGLFSLSQLAAQLPLHGLLETTWSALDFGMGTTLFKAAMSAWRGGDFSDITANDFTASYSPDALCLLHLHMRQIAHDMQIHDYETTGRIMLQVPEHTIA